MKKIYQILLVLMLTVLLTGCSGILREALVSHEKYEHIDLSKSQFASDIEQKGKEILENAKNPRDFKNAAKLFGSIRKLDEMDGAARDYLSKDPDQDALFLFKDCLEVREWYEKKVK